MIRKTITADIFRKIFTDPPGEMGFYFLYHIKNVLPKDKKGCRMNRQPFSFSRMNYIFTYRAEAF